MPRWRSLAVLLAVGVAGCAHGADDPAATPATDLSSTTTTTTITTWTRPACPTVTLEDEARIADPSLDEVSGAAVSSWDAEITWVIEDSGNPPTLTALSPSGDAISSLSVAVSNTDWEDLAILHGDGTGTIFVGDIGDNDGERPEVTVLRLAEPDPRGSPPPAVTPETLVLRLPEPADAEALLVDPLTGDVLVVTKALGSATVRVAPGAATAPGGSTLDVVDAGSLHLGFLSAILAGDAAHDGSAVALRTPTHVLWWPRDPATTIAETLLGTEPCELPAPVDIYGEALALLPDGGYLTTGEGDRPSLTIAR